MDINKFSNQAINFLKKLVSDSSDVGSKRVVGLSFAVTILTAVFVAMSGGTVIPEWMFVELCVTMLVLFGYNTYLTSKKPKEQTDKTE